MISVNNGRVSVSRGDTALLTLTFSENVPEDGTLALVTLKRRKQDAEPLWEKRLTVTDGEVLVQLDTADTDLPVGAYWWDVRLLDDGSVTTPLPPQVFEIAEVVGNAE